MNLDFIVKNQILSRNDEKVIANKSKNYLVCNFSFLSEDWRGIEKFAIFKDENSSAYNVNLGTSCKCSCTPPSDVLSGDFFRITVYGCYEGNLITTTEKTVAMLDSGYTCNIQSPCDNGEDVFGQIFDLLNSKIEDIVYDDDSLLIYSNGQLVNTISIFSQDLVNDLLDTFNLSTLAFTGSYDDLNDVPETFPPSQHEHMTEDILDFENNVEGDMDLLLISLTDNITRI